MKIKDLLDKYIPDGSYFEVFKNYILSTGVQIVPEGKFLPGNTDIPLCSKPHHKDPDHRAFEEEMFMLHDCIHQLFPMPVRCTEKEYSDMQLIGEIFVFFITEYYLHTGSENTEFFEKILNRGYYLDLQKLLKDNDNRLDWAVTSILIGDSKLSQKVKDMFEEDLSNSRHNYNLIPKDLKNNFSLLNVEDHIFRLVPITMQSESVAYKNLHYTNLPEEWI